MVVKALQDVLDRIETWPPERQEEAADLLAELEEAAAGELEHTDEQVAEIRRRLEDRSDPTLTLEEVDARLRLLLE
jgi:hypothetical protein